MVSELTIADRPGPDGATSAALCQRLRDLPAHLADRIKGQAHALPRVTSVFTRGELGLAHPRRPRGSLLFVGPTGVGKTETVNACASFLFAGAPPIRFDMSEYQLQRSAEKLLGEDRQDRGLLGRALAGVQRGILLFDEIEKAHPLVLDLFLQMLEDARITLATGETLDLTGFYVTFTSNIGSEETMRMEHAPFASVERTALMRVRDRLRPELLGRLTDIIVYARLDYPTQRMICAAMVRDELTRLAALGHPLDLVPAALEFLVRQGYHRTLGARPMRGAVERFLQEAVAERLLAGGPADGRFAPDPTGTRLVLAPAPRASKENI